MDDCDDPCELTIDGILDLHTFQPSDCKSLVQEYLAACRAKNIVELRIIHGKGRGVLRRTVHHLLERDPNVVEYYQAPDDSGGWGATIVILKPAESEAR